MMQFLKLPDDFDVSYCAADEVYFRTIAIKNRLVLLAKRWWQEIDTNTVIPKAGIVLFIATEEIQRHCRARRPLKAGEGFITVT